MTKSKVKRSQLQKELKQVKWQVTIEILMVRIFALSSSFLASIAISCSFSYNRLLWNETWSRSPWKHICVNLPVPWAIWSEACFEQSATSAQRPVWSFSLRCQRGAFGRASSGSANKKDTNNLHRTGSNASNDRHSYDSSGWWSYSSIQT